MKELYLVVNCGSSSLKFSLYEMPIEKELCSGYFERIGSPESFWTIKVNGEKIKRKGFLKDHTTAVNMMVNELISNNIITSMDEINGVGHRIVYGGELYNDSVLIDDEVLKNIITFLEKEKRAILHLPGELDGIEAMQNAMPNTEQVAVFDTAFHQTIPKENYLYAVPYSFYTDYGVRRYGFHGISYKYLTEYMQNKLGKKDLNLIICHIGSGASICCVKDGKSFDTTMGPDPLDGLMMGTRSGSIDPSVIPYMCIIAGYTISEIYNILNKESGLVGLTGKNDFRDILEMKHQGDEQATIAYNMFKRSITEYMSIYYKDLNTEVDAVIFTAGVLENSYELREDIIKDVSKLMNINIIAEENKLIGNGQDKREGIITTPDSKIPFYVIPTNEEVMIARDSYRIISEKELKDKAQFTHTR